MAPLGPAPHDFMSTEAFGKRGPVMWKAPTTVRELAARRAAETQHALAVKVRSELKDRKNHGDLRTLKALAERAELNAAHLGKMLRGIAWMSLRDVQALTVVLPALSEVEPRFMPVVDRELARLFPHLAPPPPKPVPGPEYGSERPSPPRPTYGHDRPR